MCINYADEKSQAGMFEKIVFLVRDWEHDEPPDTLDQLVRKTR